jgi:hypothetical protein
LSISAFAKIDAATQKERAFQASSPKTFGRFLTEPAFFSSSAQPAKGWTVGGIVLPRLQWVALAFARRICEREDRDNDKPTERSWVNH